MEKAKGGGGDVEVGQTAEGGEQGIPFTSMAHFRPPSMTYYTCCSGTLQIGSTSKSTHSLILLCRYGLLHDCCTGMYSLCFYLNPVESEGPCQNLTYSALSMITLPSTSRYSKQCFEQPTQAASSLPTYLQSLATSAPHPPLPCRPPPLLPLRLPLHFWPQTTHSSPETYNATSFI